MTVENSSPDSGDIPTTDSPRVPWLRWALVVAVGVLLFVGWQKEDAAVNAIVPESGNWFGSQQTARVPLAGGETRTIYWDFINIERGVRATAECAAREQDTRRPLDLIPVGGDMRIGNRKALYMMTPYRTGVVEVACASWGAREAKFLVGEELPRRRLFNGVEDAPKSGGLTLVGLVFALPLIIVSFFVPAGQRTWLFGMWVPLLLAVLIVVGTNGVWNGFSFWVIWFLVRGYRRVRRRYRQEKPETDDESVGNPEPADPRE